MVDGTHLLVVSGNDGQGGWGTAGSNGGNVTFSVSGHVASGGILVDSSSTLAMDISESSSFTGSINSDGTETASVSVTLDSTSTWTLRADSYIASFDRSLENVVANGHKLYVNGRAVN